MAKHTGVQYLSVKNAQSGRRIDNFLILHLKGVPKTRIYKMIRKGEVRVNGSRVKQNYRIQENDEIRVPPVVVAEINVEPVKVSKQLQEQLTKAVLFEDEQLLVINKSSGMVVHSGSGQRFGLIEMLRKTRSDLTFLELAHRLDKDTSGCLLLAKTPQILKELNQALSNQQTQKYYKAFVKGQLDQEILEVNQPLRKNTLSGGERIVRIDPEGKTAITQFTKLKSYRNGCLIKANLITGRTHQIRVHAAHIGHPIAMDLKYGDKAFNKSTKQAGLNRMFLHAEEITVTLPSYQSSLTFTAPLDQQLQNFLNNIEQ